MPYSAKHQTSTTFITDMLGVCLASSYCSWSDRVVIAQAGIRQSPQHHTCSKGDVLMCDGVPKWHGHDIHMSNQHLSGSSACTIKQSFNSIFGIKPGSRNRVGRQRMMSLLISCSMSLLNTIHLFFQPIGLISNFLFSQTRQKLFLCKLISLEIQGNLESNYFESIFHS